MLITFEMVNRFLYKFVIFLWDFMMVTLLFIAMALLITGTIFVFRTAFMFWFEGADPFKFYNDHKDEVKEALHNFKTKLKRIGYSG